MSKRLVVYTCIAGDYDELLPPLEVEADADYFCYTNQAFAHGGAWQLRSLPAFGDDAILASRYVKMHPHLLFPDYDVSVYIDGNMRILGGLVPLAVNAMGRGCLAMYEHPFRGCVLDEAVECALLGHDWWWRIRRQVGRYVRSGLPSDVGLYEANIVVRRHHAESLVSTMEDWWHEFRTGVQRDQLSLPYVLWKHRSGVVDLGPSDARFAQRNFSLGERHKRNAGVWQNFRRKCNRALIGIFR